MPRTIEWTTAFRRDRKRELKGRFRAQLDQLLTPIIGPLAADEPLDVKHRDHAMTGRWKDCRDCHARADLVLIYRKVGDNVLQLVRLGSHSELGI
jgi:mRNA interferase YafQ